MKSEYHQEDVDAGSVHLARFWLAPFRFDLYWFDLFDIMELQGPRMEVPLLPDFQDLVHGHQHRWSPACIGFAAMHGQEQIACGPLTRDNRCAAQDVTAVLCGRQDEGPKMQDSETGS